MRCTRGRGPGSEVHHRAGEGAGDARHRLDPGHDETTEVVDTVSLGAHDDVVGSGDPVDRGDPVDLGDRPGDGPGSADLGLDEDVGVDGRGGGHGHDGRVTRTGGARVADDAVLGSIGEFALIESAVALTRATPEVLLGPGDDAAVVAAPDGRVAVSVDMLVESRHFRRDWSSAEEVGRRAAAANLADIAAMGARCTGVVVAFAGPPDLPAAWALGVMAGISGECARVGAAVVGGDVSAAQEVIVSITALGDLQGRQPVTRSGARPGDVLAVAGRLGWAQAGLALLRTGRVEGVDAGVPAVVDVPAVVAAHRFPLPPYAAGPAAAVAGATAMIDVSDGLVGDAGHLARMSGVTVALERQLLAPLAEAAELVEAGRLCGVDPVDWVLAGGDDHALLAAFPAGAVLPAGFCVIGRVEPPGATGVTVDGAIPTVHAHEHFQP